MKPLWILLLLCVPFCSFSQTVNNLSWYKMLAGKIDRYPVTLHLHKAGHQYSGYYYYNAQQQPINFSGEDSSLKGNIKLICHTDPDNDEEFVFSLFGSEALGNWKKNTAAKPLPFTASSTKTRVSFIYVFTSGTTALRPKIKDTPTATFEAASVWPAGDSPTDVFLKEVIRKSFNERNKGHEEIGALFLTAKKQYFANYLKEHTAVKEAELKESPALYTMEESNRLMIAYLSPKILTLAYSNYAYSGGAHGNYGTTYTCIDLTSNKKLQLSDVLNEQGQKALSPLLGTYFRKSYHLQPTDSLQEGGLFENSIKPTNNFYVTAKGVGFNYTPYEIGPYALGEINLFIPVQELEAYLQPSFKSLLF